MQRNAPLLERLVHKIDVLAPDGCWQWTSTLTPAGYGKIKVDGQQRGAHRVVYEVLVGAISTGLELDHLCKNHACVNPDHLEPVTGYENWRRSDQPGALAQRTGLCKRGHSMEDAMVDAKHGWRRCRTCHNKRSRQLRQATP